MSDYLSKQRAKSVDNGIKILEDLEKERKESRDDSPTKEATGPTPKKKPRTKSRPTILPSNRGSPDVSTGATGLGETPEYGSGETTVSGLGPHELSGQYSESPRSGGSDNPRDGKSDGGDTSGNRDDGNGGPGEAAGGSGADAAGEGESAHGSTFASLSLSDIEKILTLDEESDRLDKTGELAEGMTITEATAEGIEEILNAPPSNVHRRLRGVKEAITDTTLYDHGGKVVKRGIDGNTASTVWKGEPSLEHGAARSARPSQSPLDPESVLAGYAPSTAENALGTDVQHQISKYIDYNFGIREMMILMLAKQDLLMLKLKDLDKLQRETNEIKRVLDNFGITLSTLEGYLESMMVVIPSSGKNPAKDATESNPDLRPVIGRDRARGYAEIVEKRVTFDDITIDSAATGPDKVNDDFLNFDLDFDSNNAANFVPTEDENTMRLIFAMIEEHIKDQEQVKTLKEWIFEKVGVFPLDEIYKMVVDTIEPGGAAGY